MRKVLAGGLVVFLVVAVLLVGFLARRKPDAPWFAAISNSNGYDALVQAAGKITGPLSEDKAEVAAFVKENGPMFEKVGSALKLPFEVPARMYSLTNSLLKDLSGFKSIAQALRLRGKEAEQRGAECEAATNYTSIVELGQRVEHGPVIALLTGIAIEKIGLDALEEIAPGLTPAQRKELADRLESLDRERLAFSEVALREEYYARQVAGNPLKMIVIRFYIRSGMIKAEQKQQKLSADFQRVVKTLRSNGD
jgi:hypothetical protein